MRNLDLNRLRSPKRLYLNTVLADRDVGRAVIVSPREKPYKRLAEMMQDEIKKRSGAYSQ